ncbi:MAG: hypothetical protein LBM59_05070 [Ruminococcus sp.]|jgi:hypothetical protein|nr:hypothetical protein [Ruminococcus sp.]
MTSAEYLSELRGYIDVLPQLEAEAALQFYKNEFEKSGSDTSVMLRLGNPYALAKRIISEQSEYNKSEQYKNLKKDGMTNAANAAEPDLMPQYNFDNKNITSDYSPNTRVDYMPSEKYPENAPRIKTAFDSNPSPAAHYIPPPQKQKPHNGKFSPAKFVIGCLAGFFILGMTAAAVAFIDAAWDYPGEHRSYETYAAPELVEQVIYSDNGISADGESFLGMFLQTEEFADAVDAININLNNSDVVIVAGDSFRVSHTEHITVDFSGGFLNVTNESDGGYLKIEVPETDARSSLTLNLSNGDVTLKDLKLIRLSLNISSGIITTLSNVTVTDRADISAPYSMDLSIINSVMNDTTVNAPQSQLSFINSTFSESLSVDASSGYQTDFSNCRFLDETLFDIKYN